MTQQTISINYELLNHYSELSSEDQNLVAQAYFACDNAYAPYSKFQVGASVLLSNGEIVKGSNQENIAYPSGLCAERTVLFYTGANFPNEIVETLCIVAKGDLIAADKVLSPCGACRQVMAETQSRQNRPYRVIIVCQDHRTLIFNSASDLLPLTFGK